MQTNTKAPIEFVVRYETEATYTDVATWVADVDEAFQLHQKSGWNWANVAKRGFDSLSKRHDKTALYDHLQTQNPRMTRKRMQNVISLMNKPYCKLAQDLELDIAHVEAVLGLPDDEAEALLLEAAEQSLSATAIGGIIRERRLASVAAPNTFVPAVGNDSAATDDEPPFARKQGNVLYEADDLDAKADALAGDADSYTYSNDDNDIDSYQFSGYEFSDLLERGALKLRKYAATDEQWHRQRTLQEWLKIVDRLLY